MGSLPSTHPNYLVLEDGDDLILNIIDPPMPLFKPELFTAFLSFAKRKTGEGKSILIHCNQGESRAPSLALLCMAKVSGTVSDDSYQAARADFERLFQNYRPGRGIESYLTTNWQALRES
ncbi:MAG: protein-tyrosine phosphatase family protein [Thermoleophilia bacterium]